MKITLEEAEAWYRGDPECTLSAHKAAVFYRSEYLRVSAELAAIDQEKPKEGE